MSDAPMLVNQPQKPGAWVDLALTLPIFVVYHLGVIFLDVHNATDVVTFAMYRAAEGNRAVYLLMTASIGVVFAGVFAWLGRGQAFRAGKFVQIAGEGVLYAVLMRIAAAYVVGSLFAAIGRPAGIGSRFTGLIMSLGAGFYEELAFRAILFGIGARVVAGLVGAGVDSGRSSRRFAVTVVWAIVGSLAFSAMHYLGPMGDAFSFTSFTFRFVLGAVLTLIFVLRGFAAAVWAHALYDVGVLVL